MITRRALLKGIMLTGGFCLLPLGRRGFALAAPQAVNRHLVVILMRGAVDGLSIVTPYREANYYQLRRSIALPPPGQTDGLIDLDGYFGLNPALAPLAPLWQNRTLAFIQASGSPAETRSHFEAQDIMETAMINSGMASQGWMNGLAQALPDNRSSTRALSFGTRLPKIFQGPFNVASVPVGGKHSRPDGGNPVDNPQVEQEFGALYGTQSQLGGLYSEGVSARASIMQDLRQGETQDPVAMQKEMLASAQGAPGTDGFVIEATKAADMIRQDSSIQLIFMDVGGWDTHVQQGNSKGQLANKLGHLGEALAALARNLGPAYNDTAILVMSEFGRTVAENGNAGTDHGHGNVVWLMGGGVNGGKVWGRWPGLGRDQLYQGRDLAVTTDFRSVIGTVAGSHFGLGADRVAAVVPGYQPDSGLNGIIA